MIHYESLAMKELCLNTVLIIVNYIKTRPMKRNIFAEICEKIENTVIGKIGNTVSVTSVLLYLSQAIKR
jgi:hypothetical protein